MKRKLLYNTVSSLAFQIITIVCGFILPRLFIKEYGSEINGLVSSITQFLSIISFLELGVGAVIQSSLYKPLVSNDKNQISLIQVAGNRFFRKIAYILSVYILALIVVYPIIANTNFGWLYTAMLILAMGISSFAQYYFGIIDRILLVADQRGYIAYISQIVTLLINTVSCFVLIKMGQSIQVVKLATSIIYLARPLLIRIYVNYHYHINWKIEIKEDPIKQKWNAVSQHIAHIVLNDTDIIVLTLFSTLSNVSIYSVYYLVVNGIKNLFLSTTNGFQSIIGEMWAKQEKEKLNYFFSVIDYLIHTMVVLIFTVTAVLILPFVDIYTKNIADIKYIQPLFGVILVAAHACHCLRIPYHIMIKAGGFFKETQRCYFIAAGLNIVISIVTVYIWGLIGVAVGTLVAMLYQTIWMAIYNSNFLIEWPIRNFIKQCLIDIVMVLAIIASTYWIKLTEESFWFWLFMAVEVFITATAVIFIVNLILCRDKLIMMLTYLRK